MAVEPMEAIPAAGIPAATPATGLRKWLAIGTGVGIEVAGNDLRVVVAKARPSGLEVEAFAVIEKFRERAATEWGAEYAAFARRAGVGRAPVTVVLPRQEVLVRQLSLPGVEERDLRAAVSYQIDSLHPYAEGEAVFTFARLPGTGTVLVGIARRQLVDEFANLLTEAGLRMAGFTFSAAALYGASRILVEPRGELLAAREAGEYLDVYGESDARPVFSGWFDDSVERLLPFAASELRIEMPDRTFGFAEILPPLRHAPEGYDAEVFASALAAAIVSACPRLALPVNLLPEERRTQTSRLKYIPTLTLAALVGVAALLLISQPSWQDRQYLQRLDQEIRTMDRQASQASRLDKDAEAIQSRIAVLDRYRLRSKADADSLREATNLVAPPAWLNMFQINRIDAYFSGEAEQAAALVKLIDESPLFKESTFGHGMARIGSGSAENFNIRAKREGPGTGPEPEGAK